MIKNKIKKMIGSGVTEKIFGWKCRLYNLICGFFPMKKEIIFESHPDFTCNTFELYRHMIETGVNQRYRLVWLVDRETDIDKPYLKEANVECILRNPSGFWKNFCYYKRCNRAYALVTSNRHIPKDRVSKRQLNVYLDHGSHLKGLAQSDGSAKRLKCDFVTCQSDFFIPYNIEQYSLKREQVITTGLPRNDQLFRKCHSLNRLCPDATAYRKVLLWVPTFRLHKDNIRLDCKHDYPLGLPLLRSEEEAIQLNAVLREQAVLLLIKPHPAQSLDVIQAMELSNVRYIYNHDLAKHDIQLNELLAQTDAMITDYSSVYYDYLLLDKPIAISLDDFEDYDRDKGFVFERPLDILKGVYLYRTEDLQNFIVDVAVGRDRGKEEREAVKNLLHSFTDAESSKRVCRFILDRLAERWP